MLASLYDVSLWWEAELMVPSLGLSFSLGEGVVILEVL